MAKFADPWRCLGGRGTLAGACLALLSPGSLHAAPPPGPPARGDVVAAPTRGPVTATPAPTTLPPVAAPPPSRSSATPPPPSAVPAPEDALAPPPAPRPRVDLSNTWSRSRGSALPPRYRAEIARARAVAAKPVGHYSGVTVENNRSPPHPPRKLAAGPALLTWTGFERDPDGGAQVFFQLSNDVEHVVSHSGGSRGTITVRMKNTRINVRNNQRRLDLRYFDGPVREVIMKRSGKDTLAIINLRRSAEASVERADSKTDTGFRMLVVRFAATPMISD